MLTFVYKLFTGMSPRIAAPAGHTEVDHPRKISIMFRGVDPVPSPAQTCRITHITQALYRT